MNIKNVANIFSTRQQTEKMHWGEALGLWDVARFKIIGLTISEIFLAQAKDADLKDLLNNGIEFLIVRHIEKIQGLLHAEGLKVPAVPPRKNLDIFGQQIEPNTCIEDDEIANTLHEIYRLGLPLESNALIGATRDDVRNLIWEVFSDDYRGFDKMIKLFRKKNWLISPPTV